jgi:hypothetical protein
MSAVRTANSYATNISPFLNGNSSGWLQGRWGRTVPEAAHGGSGHDRGPATHLDLSDRVKRLLARASNDQGVADQLAAFVDQRRSTGAVAPTQSAVPSSSPDISTQVSHAFERLSGGAQISQGNQSVQPTQNFATSLQAGGYTISAVGRASDGSYQIEIEGPD